MKEFNGKMYNDRHGGPFDRGSADSYYQRGCGPHYYTGETGSTNRIVESDMTADEIEQYIAGYDWNEQFGSRKEWT